MATKKAGKRTGRVARKGASKGGRKGARKGSIRVGKSAVKSAAVKNQRPANASKPKGRIANIELVQADGRKPEQLIVTYDSGIKQTLTKTTGWSSNTYRSYMSRWRTDFAPKQKRTGRKVAPKPAPKVMPKAPPGTSLGVGVSIGKPARASKRQTSATHSQPKTPSELAPPKALTDLMKLDD